MKLISVFVFAYAKSQFSHDAAQISVRFISKYVPKTYVYLKCMSKQNTTVTIRCTKSVVECAIKTKSILRYTHFAAECFHSF